MNWMEFISSIVKSIIWPVAIIILVFKLKQPVSNLISTLAKIKYKDWEFEFTIDQKLDKISFQLNKENQYGTDDQNLKDSLNLESNSEITEETHSHYNEKTSIKGDNDLLLKMEMIRLYGAVKNLYEKVSEKDNAADKSQGIGMLYMVDYLKRHKILNDSFAESLLDIMNIVHDLEKSHISQSYIMNKFFWNVDKSVKRLMEITSNYVAENTAGETSN
ncbi:hypothetical protein P8844_01745 [Bacillus spizizenii]|nr:hypothetical protein [Bacillus spizizenii]